MNSGHSQGLDRPPASVQQANPYRATDTLRNTPIRQSLLTSTLESPAADRVALLRSSPIVSLFVLAGVAGFACYAASFGLVQISRLDGNSFTYTALNVLAAALVLISMVDQFNLGSLLTQVTWIATGLVGMYRRRQSVKVLLPTQVVPEGQPA